MAHPAVRKGSPDVSLSREEFFRRYRDKFYDPAFDSESTAIDRLAKIAWDAYRDGRKAPRTRKAGEGYADPGYDLSTEWIEAAAAIDAARKRHMHADGPTRLLVISGSPRSDQTCPGEMSKSWRLLHIAREALGDKDENGASIEVKVLDLSHLASEYGRTIHPCKGCFSTSPALCHFPCSCYPNHSLGQTGDWMNEIYPMWIEAHGVMIVTPVHWDQSPSALKLMIDRLVCADGGNEDPTTTHGKDPERARAMEPDWRYPRHLAGRAYSLVVHGDSEGIDGLRHALTDWLEAMELVAAEPKGVISRYVGYMAPYGESHDALDADKGLQEEVRNAARSLVRTVSSIRSGQLPVADKGIVDPRPK
ncbi:MAG: flavodoxin family protein [Beijerinckiaceae bacterium]